MSDNALDAAVEAALDNLETIEGIGSRAYWRRIVRIIAPHIAARACAPLVKALEMVVEEKCDYMRLNHLGDPETQHTIIAARKALAAHKGEAK